MATCRCCNQNTGFLRKQHGQCRDLHTSGYQEMVQLAAQAASTHTFSEAALRHTLRAIAQRSRATDMEQASGERLMLEARMAAISFHDRHDHIPDTKAQKRATS